MTNLFQGRYRIDSTRIPGYDYSSPGMFFVTICTHDREYFFGEIIDGVMHHSEIGNIVRKYWYDLSDRFSNISLDAFVAMPNHIHGIVRIFAKPNNGVFEINRSLETCRGTFPSLQPSHPTKTNHPNGLQKQSLGSIINHYKGSVTKWTRQNTDVYTVWQSNYHEHIIENRGELNRIQQYITYNPKHWKH